jgi:hypothetical protein
MQNIDPIFNSTIKHIVRWSLIYVIVITVFILLSALYFKELNIAFVPFLGQIADFIGGLLNPLLAFVNICVFILLTVQIQKQAFGC